jgi:hypothetical protein
VYRSLSSSLCSLFHSPATSSHLGPNTLFSTINSNTLTLPQYERPSFILIQKTGIFIVMYILIFVFLDNKLEDRRFCTETQQAFPGFGLLVMSFWIKFWFVRVVTKYWNCCTLAKGLFSILGS